LDILNNIIPQLTQTQWLGHGFIFALNIALFILAKPLLNLIAPGDDNSSKIKIFRALNILVLLLHFLDLILTSANTDYRNYFLNLGYSLMIIYAGMLAYSFLGSISKKRFGRERMLDNVWAPDIISGLIILNSQSLEDGDVVVIEGHLNEYVISRVTLIYVVLYDIRNNHRTLMRNSLFTGQRVDNLSRVASTNGVRQALLYKIGYPQFTGHSGNRAEQLKAFRDSIDDMFNRTFEACKEREDVKINEAKPFEWALTNAGDYALEYTLWIYLERIPNTKITSRLRQHLMGTIYKVNEEVYTASILEDIDLSTPDVISATVSSGGENIEKRSEGSIRSV